jgi:enoyl-CoA hydratase
VNGAVELEVREGAAWLTLNRPDKLNALDGSMVDQLRSRLDDAVRDDRARVVVLRGAGRAFSAGYDLSDGPSGARPADDWHAELTRDLGGALDLALACDLVVAADDARFGVPEIRYGSGPVTLLLPFVIGQKKANELLFTGEDVDAPEAERLGLCNRVVPRAELDAAVAELVAKIAPTPLPVLRLTKLALTRAYEAMGFRGAQHANLDLGAILNALDTPEQREFDRIAAQDGLKAALAWRAGAYRTDADRG